MRFSTRTFLWSFVPFACLMLASFWDIQRLVQATVRDGIRSSLRSTHESMASVRAKNELQNSHFLRILGENATLKAGVQLLQVDPESLIAGRTVADQLRDISGTMGVDFVL